MYTGTPTKGQATTISRLQPSIAESIIRPQLKSTNIFTTNPKTDSPTKTSSSPSPSTSNIISTPDPNKLEESKPAHNPAWFGFNPFQLPLSFSQLTTLGLAMAAPSNTESHPHDHHHHHEMGHSPNLETEAMRRCSMNMIFNSQPIGTCIVFKEFYISGTMALLFYLTMLFLMAVGYEYLRLASMRFERMIKVKLSSGTSPKKRSLLLSSSSTSASPHRVSSSDNLIESNHPTKLNPAWGQISVPRSIQFTRSLFYISNVALSFFLMLVIMTYNAQIIMAVLAGAFVGHFIFHRELSIGEVDKGMACH